MSYNLKPKKPSLYNSQSFESSSTLPLYYKDKLQTDSNFWQKNFKKRWNRANTKTRMLFTAFSLSVAVYVLLWTYQFFTGDGSSNKKGSVLWESRKNKVREVFLESWSDYSKHGWGYDIYKPVTQEGENMGPKPLGWMIVDSLDTLVLMDLKEELHEARSWVKNELDYDFDYEVNVFETTIRMLGGLLSAHYLTEDDLYLEKATHLANSILGSFGSNSGLPYASVNLQKQSGVKAHNNNGASSTAEVATLQLEFKYLANLTGEALYWEKVEKIMKVLDDNHPEEGLVPIYVNPETGKYQGRLIRLGSRGDSYYEYLLKQYLQTDESIYLDMYKETVQGMRKKLLNKSTPSGLTFLGELEAGINGGLSNKMDHLVCFIGGLFALGATNGEELSVAKKSAFWDESHSSDLELGEELANTCYRMYHDVPNTGLAPEIVVFNTKSTVKEDFIIKTADRHNLQRPETVETLFYLYHITKDEKYREWGWEIFQNFVEHTRVTKGGKDEKPRYTSLDDVTKSPSKKRNNLESFWFAETLKYLYLLFEDNLDPKWDIRNVVYNTEAHPLPKFQPRFQTGWVRNSHSAENIESAADVPKKVRKQDIDDSSVDAQVDITKEAVKDILQQLEDDTVKVESNLHKEDAIGKTKQSKKLIDDEADVIAAKAAVKME